MNVGRDRTPPICPKCKGKELIRPEEADGPVGPFEIDGMGYIKCDVCGGSGYAPEAPPPG